MPLPHTPQIAIWSGNQETAHLSQQALISSDEWDVTRYGNADQQARLLNKLLEEATMPDILVMEFDNAKALHSALINVSQQTRGHKPVSVIVASRQRGVRQEALDSQGLEGINMFKVVDRTKGTQLITEAIQECLAR